MNYVISGILKLRVPGDSWFGIRLNGSLEDVHLYTEGTAVSPAVGFDEYLVFKNRTTGNNVKLSLSYYTDPVTGEQSVQWNLAETVEEGVDSITLLLPGVGLFETWLDSDLQGNDVIKIADAPTARTKQIIYPPTKLSFSSSSRYMDFKTVL